MSRRAAGLTFFLAGMALLVALAAVPIVASDLFRQPYSPAWRHINRALDLLRIDPYPVGGGQPPQFPYWADPADASIYFRDLTLTAQDGVQIAAWYVPAAVPAPRGAIILAHGLMDRKGTMLQIVPWLHEAGYHVMLLDFRGHGQSEKRPTTVGREEALDVQAALDWLEEAGAAERVGGLGMSMGAAALVNTAGQDPRIEALVLDSLFARWNETDFAADYRLSPDWLVPDVPSPIDIISRLHIPILIIHGTADILTEEEHAYRLFDAANEPKQLWINDSGHAWSAWTYPVEYRDRVLAFFDEALGR